MIDGGSRLGRIPVPLSLRRELCHVSTSTLSLPSF